MPDVDGDGRGDLLVSATREEGSGVDLAGRVYVFSGATGSLLRVLESPNPRAQGFFGDSPSVVPDVDGDGVVDILVGASGEDGGGEFSSGRAYVFSGASGVLLRTLESPNAEFAASFGLQASGVVDVDGDGRGDLLVGVSRESGGGVSESGRAYVFSGATGTLLHTLESPSPEAEGRFGWSVSGMGDADGDGRGDLLVGAYQEDGGGVPGSGRAYVFKRGHGRGSPHAGVAQPRGRGPLRLVGVGRGGRRRRRSQ